MPQDILLMFIFLGMGTLALVKGIRIRMGYEKGWHFSPSVRAGNIAWMSLPAGIVLLMWGLMFIPSLLFETSSTTAALGLLCLVGGLAVFFLGMIIAFIQPNILKPKWLRWLESEHGDIMPLLRREAREMGLDIWGQRVESQEGLEEWVGEVRRRHGV